MEMENQNQIATSATLTDAQHREFKEMGLLRLRGAIPASDVGAMCDRLWDALAKERQMYRDDPQTWISSRLHHFNALRRAGVYAKMASPTVLGALDDLFGPREWQHPLRWGTLLANFPGSPPAAPDKWEVPNQGWHVDLPAKAMHGKLLGAIVFAHLDTVVPGGGGTVVVTGTHRLIEEFVERKGSPDLVRSHDSRKLLARSDPWLRDLSSHDQTGDRMYRFMHQGTVVDGVPLKVVEVTGDPGDVIFMHPWMLHARAPNYSSSPRLTLHQAIFRRSEEALQY